jgi:molybdopterin-guanine dinucleotide biosynthesis protein A
MGGRDKPLLDLAGRPLVAHVVARLAPQVSAIVVSCNRNVDRYGAWTDRVVLDAAPGAGPLAGLAAALPLVTTRLAFVCPGDAPFLATDLVRRLAAPLSQSGADAAICHDGARLQPLFALLHTTLVGELADYLAAGERAAHVFIARTRHVVVDTADLAASFVNVNGPEDLAAAEAALRGGD